jgi:hypothetical protein
MKWHRYTFKESSDVHAYVRWYPFLDEIACWKMHILQSPEDNLSLCDNTLY